MHLHFITHTVLTQGIQQTAADRFQYVGSTLAYSVSDSLKLEWMRLFTGKCQERSSLRYVTFHRFSDHFTVHFLATCYLHLVVGPPWVLLPIHQIGSCKNEGNIVSFCLSFHHLFYLLSFIPLQPFLCVCALGWRPEAECSMQAD